MQGLIGLSKINSFKLFVTYKNLKCFCYDYLPCFNLNVFALLVLPPFYFRMFEINPFLYVPPSSTVIELFGCLPFLIAIIRLEVCDVIIMLQFVIVGLYTFSIVTYQEFFGIFDSFCRSINRWAVLFPCILIF